MTAIMHAFPDTNVLIHFPALDGLDWRGLCGAENVLVHITQPVLTELNKVKEVGYSKRARKRAAAVQRRLRELFNETGETCQLGEGVRLVLESDSPNMAEHPDLNPGISDGQLIAAVLQFSRQSDEPIGLVTDDSGLGLLVKATTRKITVLEPPNSTRLEDEADEDEKEKEQLRRRIASLESAAPAPDLFFSNGSKVFKLDPPELDVESAVKAALHKEKEKYPPLPEPNDPKPVGRMSLARLAALNDSYARLMQNDPVEVKKYNDALEEYFVEFEDAKRANTQTRRRFVRIELQVENAGTIPARDVLVDMHFPEGFTVLERGSSKKVFREMPDPPLLPGHVRGFHNAPWTANYPLITSPYNPNAPTLTIRKSNSYEVRWHVPTKLRQGYVSKIDPIHILFDAEPFSFHIDYSIVADNLPDSVSGQLHVVVP